MLLYEVPGWTDPDEWPEVQEQEGEQQPAPQMPEGLNPEQYCLQLARAARNVEGEQDVIEAEIKALQVKALARKTKQERIREKILATMLIFDITKIKDPLVQLLVGETKPGLDVVDIDKLPAEYVRYMPSADRAALAKAFAATGEIVDGCELREPRSTLTVRWK